MNAKSPEKLILSHKNGSKTNLYIQTYKSTITLENMHLLLQALTCIVYLHENNTI